MITKFLFELRLETLRGYAADGKIPGRYAAEHIQELIDYGMHEAKKNEVLTRQLALAEKEIADLNVRFQNQKDSINNLYKDSAERSQFVDKQASEIMALERQVADFKTVDGHRENQARAWVEIAALIAGALGDEFRASGGSTQEVLINTIKRWATDANKYETLVERIDEAICEIEEDEDDEPRGSDTPILDKAGSIYYGPFNWERARQFREWHQR